MNNNKALSQEQQDELLHVLKMRFEKNMHRHVGGALFCDRRYDCVFVYHNGADSYYGARGFRSALSI